MLEQENSRVVTLKKSFINWDVIDGSTYVYLLFLDYLFRNELVIHFKFYKVYS